MLLWPILLTLICVTPPLWFQISCVLPTWLLKNFENFVWYFPFLRVFLIFNLLDVRRFQHSTAKPRFEVGCPFWCFIGAILLGPVLQEKNAFIYHDDVTTSTSHDDVIKWKHFCVTGPLYGNPPVTGGAELWYILWSAPEQTPEQTVETPVIWDAIAPVMMHCIGLQLFQADISENIIAPYYWSCVKGIHWWTLMFSEMLVWKKSCSRGAGDLRRHNAHVTSLWFITLTS